ncbi:MAG: hypothetical protein K8R54_07175 [Bacteroidales bacterium]|nr:hypothetical protein [Bacteroidales bacterium]
MKRVKPTYSIIFLLISFIFISKNISAQIDFEDENRNVYWFYVKIIEIEDSTGYVKFIIKRKRKKIQEGNIKEFDRSLWTTLQKKSFLAIGPFRKYNRAKIAYSLYKTEENPLIEHSVKKSEQNVYWFVWHFTTSKTFIPNYKRYLPKSIESGTFKEFETFLDENLMMRIITVGPFNSKEEAGFAQKMYRVEEQYW